MKPVIGVMPLWDDEKEEKYLCHLSSGELKELKQALPDCVTILDDGNTFEI